MGGVVAGAVLVSLYALGTRLFPGHIGGAYDPSSGFRLAEPLGYWNALGLLTALAILLALGFAAHGAAPPGASARGGGARRPLADALPHRSAGARSWPWSGCDRAGSCSTRAASGSSPRDSSRLSRRAGVLLASRSQALTAAGATLQTAQAEGRHAGTRASSSSAVVAAAAPIAVDLVEGRLRLPQRAGASWSPPRRGRGLVAVGVLVAAGGPVGVAEPLSIPSGSRSRPEMETSSAACSAPRGTAVATTCASRGRFQRSRCSARAPAASRRTGSSSGRSSFPRPRCAQPLSRDARRARAGRARAAARRARAPAEGSRESAVFRSGRLPPVVRRLPRFTPRSTGTGSFLPSRCPRSSVPPSCSLSPAARALAAGRRRVVAVALASPVLGSRCRRTSATELRAAASPRRERGDPGSRVSPRRTARDRLGARGPTEPWQLRGEAELRSSDDARPAEPEHVRSSSTPRAGRLARSRRRAAGRRAAGSRSRRGAQPRRRGGGLNSVQNLNVCGA